jgi:hypothetical protein
MVPTRPPAASPQESEPSTWHRSRPWAGTTGRSTRTGRRQPDPRGACRPRRPGVTARRAATRSPGGTADRSEDRHHTDARSGRSTRRRPKHEGVGTRPASSDEVTACTAAARPSSPARAHRRSSCRDRPRSTADPQRADRTARRHTATPPAPGARAEPSRPPSETPGWCCWPKPSSARTAARPPARTAVAHQRWSPPATRPPSPACRPTPTATSTTPSSRRQPSTRRR